VRASGHAAKSRILGISSLLRRQDHTAEQGCQQAKYRNDRSESFFHGYYLVSNLAIQNRISV
jgi:hypothetical protein